MNKLEKLQSERAEIMAKINAIEDVKTKKENALLVGKCYKVINSYSCDEEWFLYTIVHKQLDDGSLNATQFEVCSDGRLEITPLDYFNPYDGFIEITTSELAEAWKDMLDIARSMLA